MESLFGQLEPAGATGPVACYLKVALERGIDGKTAEPGSSEFTYSSVEMVSVGERVEAPLGPSNRKVGGIVTAVGGPEILGGIPASKVKGIFGRTGASLSPALLELARWIAGYYVCPLGMTVATMMPAAVKQAVGKKTRVELELAAETGEAPKLKPAAVAALDAIRKLDAGRLPMPPVALKEALGLSSLAPVNQLVRAGVLKEVKREVIASAAPAWEGMIVDVSSDVAPTLTGEQAVAVDGICSTFGKFSVHLAHGITGSGKTEVYLRVIERAIEAGKSALVLVPEISLTPQTSARFLSRFRKHGVAVLHSGLSASQRNKQWSLAASGAARVVVGARSAVFAPLANLGVIVVDEEHDGSYKQDQLPRYHARDVAIKRGQIEGATVVLGSATPALETWLNAGGVPEVKPKYAMWKLRTRATGASLPRIRVVDITEENRARARSAAGEGRESKGRFEQIGLTLERATQETLDDGGQVILLINRRGYASQIACQNPKCGWVMTCSQCDASMVMHRAEHVRGGGYVRCHHCLSEQLMPRECPLCAGRVNQVGSGTQRVEEEVARKFGAKLGGAGKKADELEGMVRVDSDSMQGARDYFDALSRFAKGEVKLLLGTQMIAKGLDFPNVRLVGIVNADTALSLPDFRSAERTFQLISQVAGRSGRGKEPGKVIVQTTSPHAAVIRFAAEHDYEGFAADELRTRSTAGLPPITRMARIVVRDEKFEVAERDANEIAEALRSEGGDSIRVDGPMPCAVSRIANFHRLEVLVTASSRSAIQETLGLLRSRGMMVSDSRTAIDVDPIAMM